MKVDWGMNLDVAAYRRDGYVRVRDAVSSETLATARAGLSAIFAHQLHAVGELASGDTSMTGITRDAVALFISDRERYFDAMRTAQHLPVLQSLAGSERLCQIARELGLTFPVISTRQVLHFVAGAIRMPDGYDISPPHQDWRSTQGSHDAITLWVPFHDVRVDGYPLEVVRASHLEGLLPDTEHGFGHQIDASLVNDQAFVPIELNAGDVLIFSAFTVHRTGTSVDGSGRVAASFRFNNADDADFVERRYWNPHAYKADWTLRSHPDKDRIRGIFAGTTERVSTL